MHEKTTITLAGKEVELRLTMRRVELLEEHAGLDLLNANGAELSKVLRTARGITGAIFALAGGEAKLGMTREELADTLRIPDLRPLAKEIEKVFERDAGSGDSGNAAGEELDSA